MAVAKASDIMHCRDAVCREFTEQPGIRLTPVQLQRLVAAHPQTCARALQTLVDEGFLTVTLDGQYCRPEFDIVSDGIGD
jgi:hypothetical protein